MIESLYLDGKEVDLGSASVTLNFESNLFTDVGSITSNYSQSIKLPKTLRNMSVLGNPQIPNLDTQSPYVMFDCIYMRDGVELVKGKAAMKASNDDCYNISLSWGAGIAFKSFIEESGKINLNELSSTYADRPSVVLSSTYGKAADVKVKGYGMASYNSGYTGTATIPRNAPIVGVNWLKTYIEGKTGMQFDFGDADLSNEFIGLCTLKGDGFTYRGCDLVMTLTPNSFENVVDGSGAVVGTASYFYNLSVVSFANKSGDTTITSVVIDSVPGLSERRCLKVSKACELSLSFELYSDISDFNFRFVVYRKPADSTDVDELYIRVGETILLDNQEVRAFNVNMEGVSLEANDTLFFAIEQVDAGVKATYNNYISKLFFMHSQYREYLWVGTRLQDGYGDYWNMHTLTSYSSYEPIEQTFGISIDYAPSEDLVITQKLPIIPNLPDISVIDFIKEICWRKGLFPVSVDDNKVTFCNFDIFNDNIATGNVYDWSRNVIFNEAKWKSEYTISGYARNNYLRHKKYNSYSGQYDGVVKIDDQNLDLSRDIITSSFIAVDGGNYPIWSQSESGEYELSDIGNAWGTLTSIDETGTAGFVMTSENYLKDIAMDRWSSFRGIVNQPRIKTLPIRLSHFDLQTLDFSRPVYIQEFNSYFAIISVQSSSEVCTVKLIKL